MENYFKKKRNPSLGGKLLGFKTQVSCSSGNLLACDCSPPTPPLVICCDFPPACPSPTTLGPPVLGGLAIPMLWSGHVTRPN